MNIESFNCNENPEVDMLHGQNPYEVGSKILQNK